MLLDRASSDIILFVAEKTKMEKGKRLPLHNFHRWWSRRFVAIYRFLLSSYLFSEESAVKDAIIDPYLMRKRARGKTFVEPFAGGGTGLAEAALAGWSVYGIDVNPIATCISRASTYIVTRGLPKSYYNLAIEVLDKALEEVQDFWTFEGKLISYIFVSRDKAPTWISTKSVNCQRNFVVMCPKCYSIFETPEIAPKCNLCGHEFQVSMKGTIHLSNSLPESAPKWKAFAIELRNPKEKWKKEYISIKDNEDVINWFEETNEKLEEVTQEIIHLLSSDINVVEGKRLIREAGIKKLYQLFTKRQLIAFKSFSLKARDFAKTKKELLLLGLALSEATKASSLASKWHPPIGEPVPAAAMKTYWIPSYTVEANPLAHVPNTLRPLGRNTIASALRAQLKAYEFIEKNGGISKTQVRIINDDAEKARLPNKIDLAVVDPPYMDCVKSYASLSLIHYVALKIFDSLTGTKFVSNTDLKDVELKEIPRNRKGYENKLCKIFSRISERMSKNSRMVLMYNRLSVEDWIPPLKAAKRANLYPTAIYWIPGETPGSLARSKLRGIYLIVLKKLKSDKSKSDELNIIFEDVINEIGEIFSINHEAEYKSFSSLLQALNFVYSISI